MSRNKTIGLIIVAVAAALLLTSWGRLALFGLVGMVLLPAWALLLASVLLIACVALGSVVLAVSNAVKEKKHPAPVVRMRTPVREDEEDHRRAA